MRYLRCFNENRWSATLVLGGRLRAVIVFPENQARELSAIIMQTLFFVSVE